MIHFEKITWDNWRHCNSLKVNEKQIRYVAENVAILARGYVSHCEGEQGEVLAIYNDAEPVGLLFYREFDNRCYCIDQFMIDEKFQNCGYGKEALVLLIELLKKEHKYNTIELECKSNNLAGMKLYTNMGFYKISEYEEYNEVELCYDL